MNARRGQLLPPAHRILVVAVAAVDDCIALRQALRQAVHHALGGLAGWNHDPDRPRRPEFLHQLIQRPGAFGPVLYRLSHRLGLHVRGDHPMPRPDQPRRHVCAHPAQSHHAQLHYCSSKIFIWEYRRIDGQTDGRTGGWADWRKPIAEIFAARADFPPRLILAATMLVACHCR